MGTRYELGGVASMKKELYDDIMRARIAIARILIEGYRSGDKVKIEELPQPLVNSFDVLTQLLRDADGTEYRTFFASWWVNMSGERMDALELQIGGEYERQ